MAQQIRPESYPRGEQVVNAKLTVDQVREMRARHAAGGVTYVRLGIDFGISKAAARRIVLRQQWAHIE